ncbi:MAG: biopolymer transporter ExbD [Armatimonas sp.]
MRFSRRREMKKTKIEIIPMIDTMFFLLVFFILASLSIIDLRGLNMELPPAGPATQQNQVKDVQLVVRIDAAGSMSVNNGPTLAQGDGIGKAMQDEVNKLQKGNVDYSKVTLVLAPEGNAQQQYLIKCIDEARTITIEKIAIQ